MIDKYKAAMVLCGTGDAIGYKNGDWEFSRIDKILEDLEKLGGIDALQIQPPEFIVSDDTVMHNATARGLVTEAENIDKLFQNIHTQYCKCMKDMRGRAPGTTCTKFLGTAFENQSWKSTPFNQFGGGCGAAMRSMCIGLAFPKEEQLSNLVIVAVESGRMSHHCAMGYMGSVVGAAFTSFALQGIPAVQWGARIRDVVIPMAKQHVTLTKDRQPQENLESFEQFEKQFIRYLTQTKITNPTAETKPFFLEKYGYKERDDYYNRNSY
ncbi:MAG: putative ADP-ribosylarginine hydrolase [Streblomastix strix]|uniref:ADP-ribosylhydrolase ARH1 n=1 Tax=Streblomastix strix TaxID=222440 RepID=A0A5J4WQJ9_9EUKA|nr:MAG: putative ADP-ribosylarginine hydrolase [Streblomastix strix]